MDDRELVRRTLEGDSSTYSSLVRKYQTKVFNMAFSFVRNRETADDLAQEIFIKAYVSLKKFQFKSGFGTWLYRIAVNHCKDYLRSQQKMKTVPFDSYSERTAIKKDYFVERDQRRREDQVEGLVQRGILAMPEKYKTIIILRDIQGLSYDEIAKILNLSSGTVDSRIHRARKMLRQKLSPYLTDQRRES
jgi:RNA polymerase sigma-70 factor (ECF subfamily)